MFLLQITALLLFVAGVFYWIDASRAKFIARSGGKRACDQAGVGFLDDSVVLSKIRLRRNRMGNLKLYRRYRFEFSSDGSYRYGGEIELLGRRIENVTMEAYRS